MQHGKNWVRGARAGLIATGWMSLVMLIARKLAPTPKLPPRKIVEAAVDATTEKSVAEPVIKTASVAAHFAFGAATGGIFGELQPRMRLAAVPAGIAFGLLVWAASYKGWIPALKILPKPSRDNPARARTMLLAHIVYGAALGSSLRR